MVLGFLDTETTGLVLPRAAGLNMQPRVIDFSIFIVLQDGTKANYSSLVNPGVPLTKHITDLTGLKDTDLANEPSFNKVADILSGFVSKCDMLIAHNAAFDISVLNYEYERLGKPSPFESKEIICTVQEFKPLFGYNPSLVQLWEYAIGGAYQEKHRAASDAEDLFKVCQALKWPAVFFNRYHDKGKETQ